MGWYVNRQVILPNHLSLIPNVFLRSPLDIIESVNRFCLAKCIMGIDHESISVIVLERVQLAQSQSAVLIAILIFPTAILSFRC